MHGEISGKVYVCNLPHVGHFENRGWAPNPPVNHHRSRQYSQSESDFSHLAHVWITIIIIKASYSVCSPSARWGLLDFMSVACSSPPLLSSSSCSTATLDVQCSLSDLNHDHPRPVFPAGPQPRPSTPSVPCRTSTTTIPAQCSLPDLNHDHPRPVFPAGPQPRVSTPSVPCRTSCRARRRAGCKQWCRDSRSRMAHL